MTAAGVDSRPLRTGGVARVGAIGPLAVLTLLIVLGLLHRGAFYAPWDLLIPVLAVPLAVWAVAVTGRRILARNDVVMVGALLAFALWWWWAARRGSWADERQPVGSAVGFGAAFVVGRGLRDDATVIAQHVVAAVGALSALVGLVALALRWEPLVLAAQGHLRLAGTITYSNGTGALLAVALVVLLTMAPGRVRSVELVVVTAGLLATQSRGGILAAVIGAVVVWRLIRAPWIGLVLGALLGAVAVAGSAAARDRPELLVLTALLPLLAVLPARLPKLSRRATAVAAAVSALLVVLLAVAGLAEVVTSRLGTASTSDRAYEWQAGWRTFRAHPLLGQGPGRFTLSDGRTARFVHNEPLQAAADAGLVAVGLLALALLAGASRTIGYPSRRGAAGVMVTLLVAGSVDFSWHLPAVMMLAGLAVGGSPPLPERTAFLSELTRHPQIAGEPSPSPRRGRNMRSWTSESSALAQTSAACGPPGPPTRRA
ncbi:MAG: hypothetical protein QOJ79_1419 [Actinomycetota bacterium]|nr:hypothetical protein [Actinomycetota bacterium]